MEDEKIANQAEKSMKDILYKLQKLSNHWRLGMKTSLYNEVVGGICASVIDKMMSLTFTESVRSISIENLLLHNIQKYL